MNNVVHEHAVQLISVKNVNDGNMIRWYMFLKYILGYIPLYMNKGAIFSLFEWYDLDLILEEVE